MRKTQNDINYENLEKLKRIFGAEKLLEELFQSMSAAECKENLEHIATQWDIDIDEND